jgi:hypothetical protein
MIMNDLVEEDDGTEPMDPAAMRESVALLQAGSSNVKTAARATHRMKTTVSTITSPMRPTILMQRKSL